MISKILTQSGEHLLLGGPLHNPVFQSKEGRGLHRVQDSGFESAVIIEKGLFDIGSGSIRHLLVLGGFTS